MSKFIYSTLAAAVAALPFVGFADLAAAQQQPATQPRQAQPAQPGQLPAQAQPRQAQPAQPGQAQPGQPAQPGQLQRQPAQPVQPGQPAQPGQLRQTTEYRASPGGKVNDKTLIEAFLIGGNQAEIELGQLAQQQAQNPEVKQFAQRMVEDHGQALQKLQALAAAAQPGASQSELLQVIQEVNRHCQQKATEELRKHTGAEFDQAYMGLMVLGHTKMLSTLEALRGKASPALQEALAKAAETTREHHELAHQIKMKLNSGGEAARSAALPSQPGQPQEKRN